MNEEHPKRKKDKANPYTLSKNNGQFFVLFTDAQGIRHEIEISERLYSELNAFELEDISYINKVSRYHEHNDLTSYTLHKRALNQPPSLEETLETEEKLQQLRHQIELLPLVQQRRLRLYYYEGLSYDEIARRENCTLMPVKRSIDRALKKLKKYFMEGASF